MGYQPIFGNLYVFIARSYSDHWSSCLLDFFLNLFCLYMFLLNWNNF